MRAVEAAACQRVNQTTRTNVGFPNDSRRDPMSEVAPRHKIEAIG